MKLIIIGGGASGLMLASILKKQNTNLVKTFLFKFSIAYTQNLIDQHNIGFQDRTDGKGQFGMHTA